MVVKNAILGFHEHPLRNWLDFSGKNRKYQKVQRETLIFSEYRNSW